jgi:hypothetical protein
VKSNYQTYISQEESKMKQSHMEALQFCLDNFADLSNDDWKDHGLTLADFKGARAIVRDAKTCRAMLREIVEAYDFCSDFDAPEAEKMMDKARGMLQ